MLLGNNRISGTLPQDIGMLPRLRVLDVGHNRLNGYLPSSLNALAGKIEELNFGHNSLKQRIPNAICEEQSGNICRGAGQCEVEDDKREATFGVPSCSCASGSSGSFCEIIDTHSFGQLMFPGREFFDTSMWMVADNSTNGTNATNATQLVPFGPDVMEPDEEGFIDSEDTL